MPSGKGVLQATQPLRCFVQAAQVRKTSFAPPEEADKAKASMYSPDTHHFCTIHAGTVVQQACFKSSSRAHVSCSSRVEC